MKKVLVVALMLGAGLAYASSLGVPWFVDNAATGTGPIPAAEGDLGVVFIHNNDTADLTLTILYYTQNGAFIGPDPPNDTFVINALSSLAFRPVKSDYPSVESATAEAIPDRPRTTTPPNDNKKNGSIVFTWVGDKSFLTGSYRLSQNKSHPVKAGDTALVYKLIGYGHLLPTGAGAAE